MKNLMFCNHPDDGSIDRIINLDLLTTASADPDNPEKTLVYCVSTSIVLGIPFAEFVKKVDELRTNNYRIELENSAKWHNKRMEDTESIMKNTLSNLHNH